MFMFTIKWSAAVQVYVFVIMFWKQQSVYVCFVNGFVIRCDKQNETQNIFALEYCYRKIITYVTVLSLNATCLVKLRSCYSFSIYNGDSVIKY